MANRNFKPIDAVSTKTHILSFSFAPNGSSAIDQTSIKGRGVASVARSAQGVFLITLADAYLALHSAQATIAMSAATDLVPQWGAIDVTTSTGGTLVLNTNAGATPTDIAANAANRVYITLHLCDDTVT